MLAFPLPSPAVPFYTVRMTMDGADFIGRFEWNQRNGWYFGLSDAEEVVIFSPKKLVANRDLLLYCTDERRPPGVLALWDSTGLGQDPGYEDLDQRHKLVYYTEAELA